MSTTVIIAAAIALAGAWYLDTRSWKRKSREELVRMLRTDDWRFHKTAIRELQRRGEDVTVYVPRIVSLLVAESKVERAAAHVTIKDCFPDLAKQIQEYSASADVESCRAKAAPLLTKYPLSS